MSNVCKVICSLILACMFLGTLLDMPYVQTIIVIVIVIIIIIIIVVVVVVIIIIIIKYH